jgi:hypothetical protein
MAAFRTYMNGILADIPYFVGDDFHHRQAWNRFFRLIVTPWNSVCQRRTMNVKMRIKLDNPIAAQVGAFQLPASTVAELQACSGEGGIRSAIIYMYVALRHGRAKSGHATFFLFDLKRRVQWFFDPASKRFEHFYDRPALVPGYTTAPKDQAAWVNNQEAIQRRWPAAERTELDRRGCCQLLCNMVALCCLRFGIVNPRLAANLLADAYPTGQLRRALIDKMASFYNMHYHDSPAAMAMRLLAPIPNALCSTVSSATGRCCSRRACGHTIYCWQHNFFLRNPFASTIQQQRPRACGAQVILPPAHLRYIQNP